jgi:hypothetical protein
MGNGMGSGRAFQKSTRALTHRAMHDVTHDFTRLARQNARLWPRFRARSGPKHPQRARILTPARHVEAVPVEPRSTTAARVSAGSRAGWTVSLLGQDDLSGRPLPVRRQRAEVDTARAGATFRVLPVPRQVVVARLLLAVRKRGYELARDVEGSGQIIRIGSGRGCQRNRLTRLDGRRINVYVPGIPEAVNGTA